MLSHVLFPILYSTIIYPIGQPLILNLFPRAMSQAAALARIFGECREGRCVPAAHSADRNGVQAKSPAPWGGKNKLGHAQ